MSVYFASVGHYIKVGYSENPARRVKNMMKGATRYSLPADLAADAPRKLLAVIDGGLNEERACHAALADFAAGGEFFIDEPPVRDFIVKAVHCGRIPRRVKREGGSFEAPTSLTDADRAQLQAALNRAFARSLGATS